ncbi:hypothetical protein PR048_031408 [Dryococelus australis]|uniref:Uncharacterized protein n=1 Tax=Dryococelus australis TaxID=614101 RepID=A0ABQ9G563_9NEOP|nr:hypothetical protein PR048_031408 [Dryococelus australis]
MRVNEVSMEQCQTKRAGEMGDSRENPPTSGIVYPSNPRNGGMAVWCPTSLQHIGECSPLSEERENSRTLRKRSFNASPCLPYLPQPDPHKHPDSPTKSDHLPCIPEWNVGSSIMLLKLSLGIHCYDSKKYQQSLPAFQSGIRKQIRQVLTASPYHMQIQLLQRSKPMSVLYRPQWMGVASKRKTAALHGFADEGTTQGLHAIQTHGSPTHMHETLSTDERHRTYFLQEPVVALPVCESSPPHPHVLHQSQVTHLVLNSLRIKHTCRFDFIWLDAAYIEWLLARQGLHQRNHRLGERLDHLQRGWAGTLPLSLSPRSLGGVAVGWPLHDYSGRCRLAAAAATTAIITDPIHFITAARYWENTTHEQCTWFAREGELVARRKNVTHESGTRFLGKRGGGARECSYGREITEVRLTRACFTRSRCTCSNS